MIRLFSSDPSPFLLFITLILSALVAYLVMSKRQNNNNRGGGAADAKPPSEEELLWIREKRARAMTASLTSTTPTPTTTTTPTTTPTAATMAMAMTTTTTTTTLPLDSNKENSCEKDHNEFKKLKSHHSLEETIPTNIKETHDADIGGNKANEVQQHELLVLEMKPNERSSFTTDVAKPLDVLHSHCLNATALPVDHESQDHSETGIQHVDSEVGDFTTNVHAEIVEQTLVSKDTSSPAKKSKKGFSRPQFLADVLTYITRRRVVIQSSDRVYRAHTIDTYLRGTTLEITLDHDQAEIVELPQLPDTLCDVTYWYARALHVSRSGFEHHKRNMSERDNDAFQKLIPAVLNQLSNQVLKWLQSDETLIFHEDDEEDLFSGYAADDIQHYQKAYPVISFLLLLEETPCLVDRPLLDHIFEKDANMASLLFLRALRRCDEVSSLTQISKRTKALSVLFSSPHIVKVCSQRLQLESSASLGDEDGHTFETKSWFRPILRACAYCLPSDGPYTTMFHRDLERLENFPLCMFDNYIVNEADRIKKETCFEMQSARSVVEILLRKGGKRSIFPWINHVVRANDAIILLSQADLNEDYLATSTLSSQSFLVGLAVSLVGKCSSSLGDLFAKDEAAFNYRYLLHRRVNMPNKETMMVQCNVNIPAPGDGCVVFSGGTELFFLTCDLLRVSLYPSMVMEEIFLRNKRALHNTLHQASVDKKTLTPDEMLRAKPFVSRLVGWTYIFDEDKFVTAMTEFAILQLRWLVANQSQFGIIPEWMCKNPATWLSRVARHLSHSLKQHQAISTIECAMQLLQVRTQTNETLSPVLLDVLVKILAEFVNAGVSRARQRVNSSLDDWDANVIMYTSFDLGVTVFTNDKVARELCPLLMQVFSAVDVVEGLDVDREHGFDKFSAKYRIARLFMVLWSHPNGMCRTSVVGEGDARVAEFAKVIEVVIGVLLDFSCNRLADVCNSFKRGTQSTQDRNFILLQAEAATNELSYARLWLRLLSKISEEPRIRNMLGTSSQAKELASLMIHFLDILTDPDGGVHRDLDTARFRSADMMKNISIMTSTERQEHASHIVKCRFLSRARYGLDVSNLSHQCMALLACWHVESRDVKRFSPILSAFALHDDYDEQRFRNIFQRLIADAKATEGTEGDCAATIFEHDGYVNMSIWEQKYEAYIDHSLETKAQYSTARTLQMPREQIEVLASTSAIYAFLLDAEDFRAATMIRSASLSNIADYSFVEKVDGIVSCEHIASSDLYSQMLADWLVSSECFATDCDNKTFAHYYDKKARSRSLVCSGKTLVKEARRCHKSLPAPHPNSAAFTCFAEERMDLCRACITGPVDSPYAHGIFVFEVFFPADYPKIPPLVTFMTTGGGQVRFNPNLYSDGKVCLSLLGTFNAMDESQKWNPEYSSLAQVLLSIQTQLLVEEPYFNEPGNESRWGTTSGTESSTRYNQVLQLATLRHAILAPLRSPPVGLQEICLRHFRLCRRRIVVQARRWMLEAKQSNSTLYPRFEKVYVELVTIMAQKFRHDEPSLPACLSDLRVLEALDPMMHNTAKRIENESRYQNVGNAVAFIQDGVNVSPTMIGIAADAYNPWANPDMLAPNPNTINDTMFIDDELYD